VIKINKPRRPPAVLLSKGRDKRDTHCRDYDNGEREFNFDAKIYGALSVKKALVKAQHSKCCFCESKVGLDGDVEHFRPKSGCCQERGEPLERPGYYWLAYEWDNLLLCCAPCNSRHKRNFFPLADAATRVRSHRDDIRREDPLFIHPAVQDPEQFISFRREIPYAIKGNPYGRATIEALGLRREIFNERRRDRLAILVRMKQIVALADSRPVAPEWRQIVDDARQFLRESVADSAEFAGMARAAQAADFYFPQE
jgi:uncharacterized protein (TIGR02646 family)